MPRHDVAVVTDTTHYLPREIVAEPRNRTRSASTSTTAGSRARGGHRRLRRLLRRPAHGRRAADHLAALDRRLPRGLRAAARAPGATSSRSTSPAASRAPSSRPGRRRPSSRARRPAADRGRRLAQLALRRPGDGRARRAARAPQRAPASRQVAERAREAPERHARSGSRSTRSSTCGAAGASARAQAWLGGALKIKPILTFEDETCADRARAHRAAAPSSGWSTTCARATRTARRPGSSSTSRRPTSRERLVDGGREIFGSEPLFVSEIGPVIGAHAGPGLLGVGGIPPNLVE